MNKSLDPGLLSLSGHMQGALAMNRLEGGISLGHIMTDRVDNRFRPFDRRNDGFLLPNIGAQDFDLSTPGIILKKGALRL